VVPSLSVSVSDFTPTGTGNLADVTLECPIAFGPRGSETTVNGYGFVLGSFPSNRSNHDFRQRRRVSAPPSQRQRLAFRRANCLMNARPERS
jgi:hypothetical protein